MSRKRLILVSVVVAPIVALASVPLYRHAIKPAFRLGPGQWTREQPLVNPVAVESVADGCVVLADGRRLRPLGVKITDEQGQQAALEEAILVATLQGVVVERASGQGRARLIVEPRFYNWCGTSSWRWAGTYQQCPLGELLVSFGLAEPDYEDPDLTEHEARRLKALIKYGGARSVPRVSNGSFRYDGQVVTFRGLDDYAKWLDL